MTAQHDGPRTGEGAPSAAAIARQRRRAALRRVWGQFRADRGGLFGLGLLVLIALLAVLAPVLSDAAALSPTRATGDALQPPSGEFPLGTDADGVSVLLLTWWGARVSLLVGITATLISVLIGTTIGMLAAHFGGASQAILMRITDFFLILPTLVLAIALSTVFEGGIWAIVLAIGVTAWPTTARLVRAQTMTIEARPFIERSRALGGGHGHVLGKHVLPAVLPLVLANTTLTVGQAIILESTLSFLGLGDPTVPSWGGMLNVALQRGAASAGAWWYVLPPGLGIVLVVLAFTMCGRALETVLNPRLRKR